MTDKPAFPESVTSLKAQLEAAQEELKRAKEWNEINHKNYKDLQAELSRVKEVAEKMADNLVWAITNCEIDDMPHTIKSFQEALTEFANLMNKRK